MKCPPKNHAHIQESTDTKKDPILKMNVLIQENIDIKTSIGMTKTNTGRKGTATLNSSPLRLVAQVLPTIANPAHLQL